MIIENDVRRFSELERMHFNHLAEFNYENLYRFETGSWEANIRIKLLDNRAKKRAVLVLNALGAADLKFPYNLSGGEGVLLEITDIRSRQLSGLNWHVGDDAHWDNFDFMCREFTIEIGK